MATSTRVEPVMPEEFRFDRLRAGDEPATIQVERLVR
jgi:hypothetical protein